MEIFVVLGQIVGVLIDSPPLDFLFSDGDYGSSTASCGPLDYSIFAGVSFQ